MSGDAALAKLIDMHGMRSSHTAAAALQQSEATYDPIYNNININYPSMQQAGLMRCMLACLSCNMWTVQG